MDVLKTLLIVGLVAISFAFAQNTATTVAPQTTTISDDQVCANLSTNCETCVANPKCLFCKTDNKCKKYVPGSIGLPSSDICSLGDARWGICWMNFKALIITLSCIAGVILITCGCCVYCCCCRTRGGKGLTKRERKEQEKFNRQKEERRVKHEERRADRTAKHDEIRKKYGLDKSDTPYQRFDA